MEEVDQGCKGSMNLAACEIVVHPSDKTRIDISVKNEQVSRTDRQTSFDFIFFKKSVSIIYSAFT